MVWKLPSLRKPSRNYEKLIFVKEIIMRSLVAISSTSTGRAGLKLGWRKVGKKILELENTSWNTFLYWIQKLHIFRGKNQSKTMALQQLQSVCCFMIIALPGKPITLPKVLCIIIICHKPQIAHTLGLSFLGTCKI